MTATPSDLNISPRHLHFDVETELQNLWHSGDVFKTAFFNALSIQFPEGELQFIRAIRLYRQDVTDPALMEQIRGFIGQEGIHSREHKRYNNALRSRSYAVDLMERRFAKYLAFVTRLSRDRQLAGTCGAEHYTAVLAHHILSNPAWMEGAASHLRAMWCWHAVEELEHKAVAFDVYQSQVANHRLRTLVFLLVTYNFFKYTFLNICSMLRTEGKLWNLKTWIGGLNFLWGKPGVLRLCLPDFLAYMRRDFHPWQVDDRSLVLQWRSAYEEIRGRGVGGLADVDVSQ